MELQRALDQISEIHGQLAKTDIYRGYRAVPVALSGVLAIAAAALQPHIIGQATPESFVYYWAVVATLGCITSGGGIVYSYVLQESELARRHTRVVVGQLLPCVAAGFAVTGLTLQGRPDCIPFLPGLWAMLFSLGIFASRPYLPHIIGWDALFYLAAGLMLLARAGTHSIPSPWEVGLTFGIGQVLAGLALYWNLERKSVR